MSDEFYQKLTHRSTEWSDAERDASIAELDAQQAYARAFLKYRGLGQAVEEAKKAVEATEDYREHQLRAIQARHLANLTKRAVRDSETSFERWRTICANERFTSRAAT